MHRMMVAAFLAAMGISIVGAQAANVSVDQNNLKFSPNTVTLKAGDEIVFLNNDDVTHNINVINSDGEPADQGLQKPKQSITTKFPNAGGYQVRCAIHPRMKMTVAVQ